jgi:hypothetical protein
MFKIMVSCLLQVGANDYSKISKVLKSLMFEKMVFKHLSPKFDFLQSLQSRNETIYNRPDYNY